MSSQSGYELEDHRRMPARWKALEATAVVYNESAMATGDTLDAVLDRRSWWRRRRLHYNLGIAAAGVVAFIGYVTVIFLAPPGTLTSPTGEPPDVNGLTTAFQAAGYLVAMGVANICYGLGSLAERLIRPEDVMRFRRRAFAAGLAFSVALPFAIPVAVLVRVVTTVPGR